MRYYIIAGERSGDLHAGNLCKALALEDPNAEMRGFGGEYMQSAKVKLDVHYRELAVMGFWEVLTSLRKISRYLNRCKTAIENFKPDVIILVDFGGFNKQIAAWAHARGIKVFYYISPKVWAWNQNRAWKLKATVDRMFVILPFEKDFYKRFNWEVDYVGNPVMDAVKAHQPSEAFLTGNDFSDKPLIALLPGSRKQEVTNIVGLMAKVAPRFPDYNFVIAAVDTLDASAYSGAEATSNLFILKEDTYNLLSKAKAAIVTSGTATLETALFRVPQIVVYRTTRVSYWIARMLIKVDYISLVNLIAGREVVKELIQDDFNIENITNHLERILSESERSKMLKGYDEIWNTLDIGSASHNTATLMVRYLHESPKKDS